MTMEPFPDSTGRARSTSASPVPFSSLGHSLTTIAPSRAKTAVFGLFLSVFLAMLDAQVVATALPRIAAEFGGTGAYAWVTTAYLLAGSVTAPLYGKLGDV